MPIRVEADQVRVILPEGSMLSTPQIDAAIVAASCSVDQIASGCAAGLSDGCLEQVELFLSAHFAAATENTLSLKSERDPCGGGSATYGFEFGKGVLGTPFGQMANTISGGCLATMDEKPVRLFAIGCH